MTYTAYGLKPVCAGCGRKLASASKEPALWFQGFPKKAVYGYCCWKKGAQP